MIINIFSAYVELLLKDINHPEFLQEWKLNLDALEGVLNTETKVMTKYWKLEFHIC